MQHSRWDDFSTMSVDRHQRIHRWNDYGSETLCDMVVDPIDRDLFDARLSRTEFGALGMIDIRTSRACVQTGHGRVGCWASRQRDALAAVVVESGTCVSRQGSVELEVRRNGLIFLDLTRPYHFSCEGDLAALIIKIPYSSLASRIDDPAPLLGRHFDTSDPTVSMMLSLIRSSVRILRQTADPARDPVLAELLLNAVSLFPCSEAVSARHCRDQALLRRKAIRFIARNLDDPDLSVTTMARALSVSQRQLQRAFAAVSQTPVQAILAQRLDGAAARLTFGGRSVFDVALSVGFNDASHFSRAFSRRFGVSPGNYRGTGPVSSTVD